MSQVISVLRNASATRALILSAALASTAGCAHQAQQKSAAQQQQIQSLQARLDEAERTNGRLAVRIEELEDDVFLLQDRVDANRIALQRRGIMGPQAQANNLQKPAPAPETYWGASAPAENPYATSRPVTRIPLGGGENRDWQVQGESYVEQIPTSAVEPTPVGPADDSDLVITEKEFNAFEAQHGLSSSASKGSSSSTTGKKVAQPPVTDEKLPTSAELDSGAAAPTPAAPAARKDALGSYKDALAEYRSGEYRAALTSFEAFLAAGPDPDYLDNALYWIGECHFGLGQYDDAVNFFQRVMREQPDGNKVPDAMLKMSLAFDRVGRGDEATRLLEDLNRQYPATNAGRLASQKLAERK